VHHAARSAPRQEVLEDDNKNLLPGVVYPRPEKRMVEECKRRILEFPLDMEAREVVAKQLSARVTMLGRRQIMQESFFGSGASVVVALQPQNYTLSEWRSLAPTRAASM
jgi:hypothetical protein